MKHCVQRVGMLLCAIILLIGSRISIMGGQPKLQYGDNPASFQENFFIRVRYHKMMIILVNDFGFAYDSFKSGHFCCFCSHCVILKLKIINKHSNMTNHNIGQGSEIFYLSTGIELQLHLLVEPFPPCGSLVVVF